MKEWGRRQTSGCALMIAILLVRCGSSVYVQKKSCSLTSRGGAVSASGELCNCAIFLSLGISEVVTVDVEAGILNDWYACVSRGNSGWRRSSSRFTVCFSHGGGSVLAGLQFSGVPQQPNQRACLHNGFFARR